MKSDKENTDKTNLHKIYNSHLHDNFVLRRHKTDLDQAKLTALRQLNHDEDKFLRKYEKYTEPGTARSRRSSIDASITKVSEVNAVGNQPLSRSEEYVQHTPLHGRSVLSNDGSYSVDSWNSMLDSEKNIIDSYKRSILFGDNGGQRDKGGGKITLGKKQTLKPIQIQSPTIEFSKDGFNAEIQKIQGSFRKRSNTCDSSDMQLSLNKLRNRRLSTDGNMAAIRLPSLKPFPKYSPRTRKKKTSSSTCNSSIESSDDDADRSDNDTAKSRSADSNNGILRKRSPRPVANASVFIHEDRELPLSARRNRRSSFDINTLMENDNDYLENLRRKTRSPSVSFLPIIPQSPILFSRENQNSEQSLRLEHDTLGLLTPDGADSLPKSNQSSPRIIGNRRPSLSTTALKLMVDTHHGAAKLRYIARLAHEMEKEENAKLPLEERMRAKGDHSDNSDKMFEDLRKCRYLRLNSKRGSSEGECSDPVATQ